VLDELNKQLEAIVEKMRAKSRLEGMAGRLRKDLMHEEEMLLELEAGIKKEGNDVKRLEGLSLTGLFYTVLGSREQQMEKERQEFLAAQLKYDECNSSVKEMKLELAELEKDIARYGGLEDEYASVMSSKERLLLEAGNEEAKSLIRLSEDIAGLKADIRELKEAITSGKNALEGLGSMVALLKSAENWGTWDMLGGGFFATHIKHSRIDDARDAACRVQGLLRRFRSELEDVDTGAEPGLTIDIGSFATFSDYFFDGLISDWIVQSRIRSSLSNTDGVRHGVAKTVQNLQRRLGTVRTRLESLEKERRELIERA
jgi:hypothetical protein